MSSLWTPGGERPVRPAGDPGDHPVGEDTPPELSEAEMQEQMAELRDRLANTPAEIVVANHAYGLFELAALHLSLDRPQLEQARLAIDALGFLVEGLGERMGEPATDLNAALAQLRLAFVQVQAAQSAGTGTGPATGTGAGPGVAGSEPAPPEA